MPNLQPGDWIAIVSPAKAIEQSKIDFAKSILEQQGYRVWLGNHVSSSFHYFSGTDAERASDMQKAIDSQEIKVIVCARGGYGCVRIVENINWENQMKFPKWLVGFSDITVFHQKMAMMNIPSLHATMPLNFDETSENSLKTLFTSLKTRKNTYEIPSHEMNIEGEVSGELIGGNLSIIYSLIGSKERLDYRGKILFIEEVGEALYAIDRMFYSLEKAGILDEIVGLIVGGITTVRDSEPGFGQTVEEIIVAHLRPKRIPLCFGFPAGHQFENWALILGEKTQFTVCSDKVTIKTIKE